MKKAGFPILGGIVIVSAGLILGIGGMPRETAGQGSSGSSGQSILAGRNVNMVSGTKLPFGDPWLQRQNEPSIAASTRNPLHLLAGANDYRTIDVPEDFKLPGIERTAAADAWLGVYESFDGGQSWITTLLPGFPQDVSEAGRLSPLSGYETACDPIVRAGANGLFYYCGIAFNRTTKASAIFVARYMDDNNLEKVELTTAPDGTRKYSGPIQYIDTRLVATGSTSGNFIDMPNLAVDVPRGRALYGTIYVAYTVFSSTGASNTADKIFLQRSTDGGVTWSAPVQLSTTGDIVQRPIIAVDPTDLKGNTVYVAFRRFAKGTVPDGIAVVRSTNGGKTFSKLPDPAPSFNPFDQSTGSSPASFRTNSYPTMAVGDLGTVYVAWSQRQGGPAGQARIVISALRRGDLGWTPAQVVDGSYSGIGHQYMPSLAFAAWKLMLAWYDQRGDVALDALPSISDSQGLARHTIDVRAAEGSPGVPPRFSPSVQLSRYLHVLDLDANGHPIQEGGYNRVIQAEYNRVNYPLFQLGTVPFHGDYLEITPSVRILPPAIALGSWIYNINPLEPTSFHAAWTDNRDVRPPDGDLWGDWVNYNAPGSAQDNWPAPAPPMCVDGSKTGMRNQNIYTSLISKGLVMGSPGNTKQLDLPMTGEGGRTFVVFVKNTTAAQRTLNLVLLQIGGVDASFDQFRDDNSLEIALPPYSSVSCTVYVDRSTRSLAPVVVSAFEGVRPVGYVVLNPDPTNLPLNDPDNPFQDLGKETHDPDVSAPSVWNYDLAGTSDPNAAAVLGPRVQNPRVQNDSVVNPRVQNEGVLNPRVQNESIVNNEVPNPRVQNTAAPNAALTDVTWTVTNEGNTTSVFTVNIRSLHPDYFSGTNPPLIAQILVYKVHRVPIDKNCQLFETHQDELIANVSNPRVQNPRVQNSPPSGQAASARIAGAVVQAADLGAQDITFHLAPDEQAEVTFRVWDDDTTDGRPTFSPDLVIAEAVAGAVNTDDVEEGRTTPPSDVPPNADPWTTPEPQIGVSPLSLSFAAVPGVSPASQLFTIFNGGGGTLGYAITDDASWLSVTPVAGTMTPQDHSVAVDVTGLAVGTYRGTISISDPRASNNPVRVPVTLTISATPFSITTTSVPDAIVGVPYSAFLEASGGNGDVAWSVVAGALPPGVNLESTEGGTGWLVGTPTAVGPYVFTVQAQDALAHIASRALGLTVAAGAASTVALSGPVQVGAGFVSGAFRVTSRDAFGNPSNVSQDTVFNLASGSAGTFFADPAGTTPLIQVTIPSGQSSAPFYYFDETIGTPNLTATWSSGGGNLGSSFTGVGVRPIVYQIVFESSRDAGVRQVYAVNADGTGVIALTSGPAANMHPSPSPSGGRIVFASERDGNREIYVMNAAGGNPVRLTTNSAMDELPVWSPDETRIAFERDYEIWSMDATGQNEVNLTNNGAWDSFPNWSPDGSQILFSSDRTGTNQLFIMNANGSEPIQLTAAPIVAMWGSWSPDGTRIAFSGSLGPNLDIYTIRADGTGLVQLTSGAGSNYNPRWSADGARITFMSSRDGNAEIYLMNSDGTSPSRLTNNPADDAKPVWAGSRIWYSNGSSTPGGRIFSVFPDGSGLTRFPGGTGTDSGPKPSPDGTKVAFVRSLPDTGIYVMRSDGTGATLLTDSSGDVDADPCWSPDGTRIAFSSNRAPNANYEIYVMNADGTSVTALTSMAAGVDSWGPDWSPEGDRIAFTRGNHGSGAGSVWVMNVDGTGAESSGNPGLAPCWSPDGTLIAYANPNDILQNGVYTMPATTHIPRRLTSGSEDTEPCWSPDGRRIAFLRTVSSLHQIHLMTADGTGIVQLTTNATGGAELPAWGPQPLVNAEPVPSVSGRAGYMMDLMGGDVFVPSPNVVIHFSGGQGTATTDTNGRYFKSVPSGWTGTVVPAYGPGYYWEYAPAYRTYSNVLGPVVNQNYTTSILNFGFNNQPGTTAVGAIISPALVVYLFDEDAGTPLVGVNVTVALGANPSGATLTGGGVYITGSDGSITLSGLSINTAGSGYTIIATAAGRTASTLPFNVY